MRGPTTVPPGRTRPRTRRRRHGSAPPHARGSGPVDAAIDAVLVLTPPGMAVSAEQVELVVERVDPDRRATVRPFEVDVPARELALLAAPEDPHGVAVAGPSQHQRPMTFPVPSVSPGMLPARPAGNGTEGRSLGEIGHQQIRLVRDDDRGNGEQRATLPDLADDDHVAGVPGHAARAAGSWIRPRLKPWRR